MKTIFEKTVPGRSAVQLPSLIANDIEIENSQQRGELNLPEVSELDIVRHYTALSKRAFGVDDGFYPLGSCTMKYNPKINEDMSGLSGFSNAHPWDQTKNIQGVLEVIYRTQEYLKEVTGFTGVTLQPTAGAHGELTAVMMMQAYYRSHGDAKRNVILIPDSAHGTNPATANMCGFKTVTVPSDKDGYVDLAKLDEALNDSVVGLMLTIPNTVGLFDKNILDIAKKLHDNGSLLYMDGANLNAILGLVKPADMGVDLMHINLHKTFSTPHGGGGPGGGFVGCVSALTPYLPADQVMKNGADYQLTADTANSIGRVRSFYSNFGVIVRALTYMLRLGKTGTERVGRYAVLNANYVKARLHEHFDVPFQAHCMHEVVFNDTKQQAYHVTTMDIAKRLLDFGYHPPTIYFPLIVPGALMIEPTENESKETLDEFCDVMINIAKEAQENPSLLQSAPQLTPVGRVDSVKAARQPIIKYGA
ncbi:MAG: aminomethyl-transferring glycine dehydrogenase subunit GcvPB [Patescibacteria group bacterium]